MQPAQSAAKVTVNGRHHFSFHQRLTQGAAGFKRRVVGRLRADHALAHKIQPRAVAVTQHLAAHGRAAEGDGAVGVQIAGLHLIGCEQRSLCARGGHALGNGLRHRLRIACAAPINNSSFHFRKFLSFCDVI